MEQNATKLSDLYDVLAGLKAEWQVSGSSEEQLALTLQDQGEVMRYLAQAS